MKSAKLIESELQDVSRKIQACEIETNKRKALIDQHKERLSRLHEEDLTGKSKGKAISATQKILQGCSMELDSLSQVRRKLETRLLVLQSEMRLAQLYEEQVPIYLAAEKHYFASSDQIFRQIEEISSKIAECKQSVAEFTQVPPVHDLLKIISAELGGYSISRFLEEVLAAESGQENNSFMQEIQNKFNLTRKLTLPDFDVFKRTWSQFHSLLEMNERQISRIGNTIPKMAGSSQVTNQNPRPDATKCSTTIRYPGRQIVHDPAMERHRATKIVH